MDWTKLLDILAAAKVELQPLYAVVVAAIMGVMRILKDPDKLSRITIYSKRTRAWTVAGMAFGLVFSVGMLVLDNRDWLGLTATSVIVALLAAGAHDWISSVGGAKDDDLDLAQKRADDPRRN